MHHIRQFLFGDEIASLVFGQAFARGPDLGEISLGIELLAGLGERGYGVGVAAEMRRNIENLQCSKPF